MKTTKFVLAVAAATLVLGSVASNAQGQRGGQQAAQPQAQQQMQQQQQRQVERAMNQQSSIDQERMQQRDRDRTQDRDQTKQPDQPPGVPAEGIYGGNLMTVQERNQYRDQLGALSDEAERNEFKARHREQMQVRAKERGVEPEVTPD